VDAEHFGELDRRLDARLQDLKALNRTDAYELGDFDPRFVPWRTAAALAAGAAIAVGETAFNAVAFQVMGENLLFAVLLSFGVTVTVLWLAHATPMLHTKAQTAWGKRLALGGTFLLATAAFTALAVLRARYLAAHDVQVEPVFFVAINLLLFTAAVLLAFFAVPSADEFKRHAALSKLRRAVETRRREIEQMPQAKRALVDTLAERTKQRQAFVEQARRYRQRICKMYAEAVAVFARTNRVHRRGGPTPACFLDPVPGLDFREYAAGFTDNRPVV
jgi:hypothetical protein